MAKNNPTVGDVVKRQEQTRVTVRFSCGPAFYHLIEVIQPGQNVCLQIDASCDRETVAAIAAKVRGLGAV